MAIFNSILSVLNPFLCHIILVTAVDNKFPESENRVYKLFLPSKLPRKFGLMSMASEYSLGLQSEGMPPDAPSAKAKLSTLVYEKIMSEDYPDKDSEA